MLDYLAADYGRSVKDGQVANADEYAEIQRFAHTAERQIAELPAGAQTQALPEDAGVLRALVTDKPASAAIDKQTHKLTDNLLVAYPVPIAPSKMPDPKRGATLYQSQCTSCHGSSRHADSPLAAKLGPPPIALADHQRA